MQHCQRPLAPASAEFNFQIHRITTNDPERPESKYNCTKDEARGDFLRPPHKHLTPATVIINTFWWNDLPEAQEWVCKFQVTFQKCIIQAFSRCWFLYNCFLKFFLQNNAFIWTEKGKTWGKESNLNVRSVWRFWRYL